MKLYILRHEDRNQDATFFSPLTKQGLENSIKLIDILKEHKINNIYSSPYIRTLQTIYPYSKKNNLKIKLEYGLCEINHQDIIPKNSYNVRLPEYLAEQFNCDLDYNEKFAPEEISYPENEKKVNERIKNILKYIMLKYHNSNNDNIILVTHQIVCNLILKIVKKSGISLLKNKELKNYPKGGLTQVFDNKSWVCKPINLKL